MKVKEVDRTANIAWSPAGQVPAYLAAGTAAQQLDATFSTNSELEIYSLNLSESGHDMPVVASLPVEQRFHKIVWGASGMEDGKTPSGLIVGGSDRGMINMYDAAKLVAGENALVFSKDKHTGPVAALDFNPFQANLLASGGSESELYIWDVNKLGAPMTPGAKSQPVDDVRCVAWNRQVQHILASTFSSRCVVWDLRKNDPIIKVSDSTSRMRCKVVAWHPDVATQLCLASEDDHTPVIQIWDLRLASSPLKTLESHQRGVLGVAWCQADSDLLLSCGKDNRILIWNPNSPQGEVVAELPTSNQWSFDVSWCPRNPAVIASASFDGHVSLYSLMGGQQQVQPTNRITESFGPSMGALQRAEPSPPVTMQLKTPPKWLRRPCGATFGFGGKLVTYENVAQAVTSQQGTSSTVYKPVVNISQVVTEPELVESSTKLETSLAQGNYIEFCDAKLGHVTDSCKNQLWQFIQARFLTDPSTQYLNLLGINRAGISARLSKLIQPANKDKQNSMEELSNGVAGIGTTDGAGDAFDEIAATSKAAEAEADVAKTPLDLPFTVEIDEETKAGQLSLALIAGDIELAVDICIDQNRMADALILAMRGSAEILHKTQARYFQREAEEGADSAAGLIQAVAMDDWTRLVSTAGLSSWKEVLAAVVTYCPAGTMAQLATSLGDRLIVEHQAEATLCYVVAGDLDKVVTAGMDGMSGESGPDKLQELVEVVMMVRAAVQASGAPAQTADGRLAASLSQYASLLAAQGSLATALTYLGDPSSSQELLDLKDRLEKCLSGPAAQPKTATVQSKAPVDRRLSQEVPRRSSKDQTQFNTGLPNYSSYGYPSQSTATAPSFPSQPPTSYPSQTPASIPTYPSQPPTAVPTFPSQPPASNYQGFTPAADPVQTFKPPDLSTASTSLHSKSSLRGRAVDPTISSSYGGGGSWAPQQSFPTPGMYPGYAPTEQPMPAIFTPEVPAIPRSRSTSQSSSGPLPPPAQPHVPDQGGVGHTPPVSSGSGWNDPPPMMKARAPPPPTNTSDSIQEPITQPLFGTAPEPMPAPGWGPGRTFQPQQPQFQSQPSGFPPQQPGYPQQQPGFQPQPSGYQQGFQGFNPSEEETPAPPAEAEPEPVPPPPIPAEHQIIQDVLDILKSRCQQAASHPQIRRKLDDVGSKLEILYNKLRSGELSPATLDGLHNILQNIRQYDYQGCLQVIAHLVQGGSFSELADFMPGVKVLLQVAQQLGVYIEYQQ